MTSEYQESNCKRIYKEKCAKCWIPYQLGVIEANELQSKARRLECSIEILEKEKKDLEDRIKKLKIQIKILSEKIEDISQEQGYICEEYIDLIEKSYFLLNNANENLKNYICLNKFC